MRFPSRVRVQARAGVALAVVLLSACTTWRTHSQGAESLMAKRNPPSEIEVITQRQEKFRVKAPRIVGDSLTGIHADTSIAFPLIDIAEVKEEKDRYHPGFVVLGVMMGALLVASMDLFEELEDW